MERYLPLARMLAPLLRTSEPADDLEQVAYLGLVQAVDRFDARRGTPFPSFAVPTVLGELRRHFGDRTWAVRVPRHVRGTAIAAERATEALGAGIGRAPSADEVAPAIGASVEPVLEAREAAVAYRCESLDRPARAAGDDGAMTLGERLGAQDADLEQTEEGILLEQIAATLSTRDREALRLRFQEDPPQRGNAERVGISQMRVTRILRESMRRLQERAA